MLYREGKELPVPKVMMVKMALLESLDKMVLLENQDLKDHLVIKAVMQLSKIVDDAHHSVPLKAFKVVLVSLVILAYLASLAGQVLVVNLVDAFLVNLENLEKMVNQVMMEPMVNLVNQVSLEVLEMPLVLRRLSVEVSFLA